MTVSKKYTMRTLDQKREIVSQVEQYAKEHNCKTYHACKALGIEPSSYYRFKDSIHKANMRLPVQANKPSSPEPFKSNLTPLEEKHANELQVINGLSELVSTDTSLENTPVSLTVTISLKHITTLKALAQKYCVDVAVIAGIMLTDAVTRQKGGQLPPQQ